MSSPRDTAAPRSIPIVVPLPAIIQGGMGIGVSNWTLARAVAQSGGLGVVSATALDSVLVRRLQDGDDGGHMRRAMAHFPIPGVSDAVLRRYFLPEGRADGAPYSLLSMYRDIMTPARRRLTMLANFVEVFLAREGHSGPIGINLLTKVQLPTLDSLYGAMLAGVDVVLMGAGIPREIPGVLDALATHGAASIRHEVEGETDARLLTLEPLLHWPATSRAGLPALARPRFLPVISAHSLATTLARKASGRVDGFVVEGPTAGGHNAPPRGGLQLDALGQPVYGERDRVDLAKIAELGLPFWLAGGAGSPEALQEARAAGAAGVQVGTLFAYCDESGLATALKAEVLEGVRDGRARIRTDPRASPTGYPFKVVEVDGARRQDDERVRICDLGYLRSAVRTSDGRLAYRCPAEPVASYVAKGGDAADTVGRRCLCNGLLSNIGHAQRRAPGEPEAPLLTSGDDLLAIGTFLGTRTRYSAADVVEYLLSAVPA